MHILNPNLGVYSQLQCLKCTKGSAWTLLLLFHLITHPTKCYSKVRAPTEKTNSEQVQKSQDQLTDPSIQQATHSNTSNISQKLPKKWLDTNTYWK